MVFHWWARCFATLLHSQMLLLSFPYRHRPHRHQTPSRLALKRDGPGTLQISKTINMFNKRFCFKRVAPFKEFGFRNPGNFCLRNPESCALESGIKRKEYGIPMRNTFPLTKTVWSPKSKTFLDPLTWGEKKVQKPNSDVITWNYAVSRGLLYSLSNKL